MTTYNITGTVKNTTGGIANITGTFTTVDTPVISSVVVSPSSATTPTLRTITINATDPANQALTYTCLVNGVAATATTTPNVFTVKL